MLIVIYNTETEILAKQLILYFIYKPFVNHVYWSLISNLNKDISHKNPHRNIGNHFILCTIKKLAHTLAITPGVLR